MQMFPILSAAAVVVAGFHMANGTRAAVSAPDMRAQDNDIQYRVVGALTGRNLIYPGEHSPAHKGTGDELRSIQDRLVSSLTGRDLVYWSDGRSPMAHVDMQSEIARSIGGR